MICLFLVLPVLVSGQGCLRVIKGNSDLEDPPFEDGDFDSLPASNAVQAIIPTYKFSCDCVNITSWETYVEPGGMGHRKDRAYDITFQVWRPSPTVQENGCYSLVGQNIFANISFPEGGLVQLTPTPPLNTMITAQSGDVVGYYTNSRKGENDGIQLQRDNEYNGNIIWYHDVGTTPLLFVSNECPFPVGAGDGQSLRSSTRAAPMLKISTSEVPCSVVLPSSTHAFTFISTSIPSPTTSLAATLSLYNVDVTSTISPSEVVLPVMSSLPSPSKDIVLSSMQLSNMNSIMLSSIATVYTTDDVLPGVSASIIPLVASLIAIIVMILIILASLLIIIFLLRRRQSRKLVKVQTDSLNLSNPNYESSTIMFLSKENSSSKKSKKRTFFSNPLSKMESKVCFNNSRKELNEESLDSKEPEYAYAEVVSVGNKISSRHIESDHIQKKDKDNALYHVVGPDTRLTFDRPESQEKPSGYYHVLEGPVDDTYEEAKITKFRPKDSNMKKIFDSTGYYVPTIEERHGEVHVYQECPVLSKNYHKLNFFVEDDIYWAPATTTSGLYSQLASKKYREIPRNQISLLDSLGSGQFGEVYKATWSIDEHELELAVKTLKAGASEEDKVKFLQEAAIMGQFSHTNVIKMYGVVTVGEPIYICLEILQNGDLREFLQNLNVSGSKHGNFVELQQMFLKFAKDIAAGMEYLSKKNFVHRDLAARNVLLDKSQTCKVADFGMARDLMDDTYYTSSGGKIPVKWTAPEALLYRKYSTDSDVWSYGMVLFEIWSVGRKPFSMFTNNQVLRLMEKGFCQAPPPGCPRAIYELMINCWNPDHQYRPSFKTICQDYLKQPSSRLLFWAPEDDSLSAAVAVSGASLEEAEKLHLDLQMKYKSA